MNVGFKKFMIVWFALGIVWAWGIVAIMVALMSFNNSYVDNTTHPNLVHKDMPEIVNIVKTIPVEVYKLERTE